MGVTSTRSSHQDAGEAMDSLIAGAGEASVQVFMKKKVMIFFLSIV